MAALSAAAREVFTEGVKAVLEAWPVLQIAVDNGFGGVYSQQKADWMVDAVQQYFSDNDHLQQYEVEDFVSELMNNEFDTVVDDGSLPEVAQQVCQIFKKCQEGLLEEVKGQVSHLQKKRGSVRAKATPAPSPAVEADSEEEGAESMECDGAAEGPFTSQAPREQNPHTAPSEEAEDGWTVVRRRK
ncbi:pre-rRNA-processing protein TSR2 homolog [Denticeps clupeoides]|uniref:Pre-rRNA-processing protein TSR2 homolog n=1 Tax=Denticeps clupeoides TaxID=299321 RepID=A0AAY4B6V9_9TELE|nr:pre-rRNA-processing protein TSR2 homolog [Denticeps clupeoides]